MQPFIKIIKNKQTLRNVIFLMLIIALSIDFYIPKYSITLFYVVGYIAIAHSVISVTSYLKFRPALTVESKLMLFFVASLIIFGLSKMLWAVYNPSITFYDIVNNYYLSGKRLIISAFIIFYFQALSADINRFAQRIASITLLLGLFMMSIYGCRQVHYFNIRAQLNADSATTAAYQILFYFSTSMAITFRAFSDYRLKVLLIIFNICLAALLLSMTETRSAIIMMPFLLLLFFYKNSSGLSRKQCLASITVIIVVASMMIGAAWLRVHTIYDEIFHYNNNGNTSLGARFSMWDASIDSLPAGFFGQSSDTRYDRLHAYIIAQDKGNPEALRNIQYHVHNEVLESLSLQGSAGAMALFLFYLSLLILSFHQRSGCKDLLYITFPLIAFGLSDVLFLQSAAAMAISINIALLMALKKTDGLCKPA